MKKRKASSSSSPSLVLCFGDSNTFGQADDSPQRHAYADRWTTHLQQELGASFIVMPEGLNGRTTTVDDPWENAHFCGVDGAGMNGRRYLLPCLYSHRPISVVVLALGCNDLKARHCLEASDIAKGVRNLVTDCVRSTAGPDEQPPKVVVISPPACGEVSPPGCESNAPRLWVCLLTAACKRRCPRADDRVAGLGLSRLRA